MGGTFMALPEDYRDYFIRNLHDALSGHFSDSVSEAVRQAKRRIRYTCKLNSPIVFQVFGEESNQMHRHHDRDQAGLLFEATPERHA